MKSIALALVGTLPMAGLSLAAPKDQTYTGETTDSACATMGLHAGIVNLLKPVHVLTLTGHPMEGVRKKSLLFQRQVVCRALMGSGDFGFLTKTRGR